MTAFDTLERQLQDAAAGRRRRRRGRPLAVLALAAAVLAVLVLVDGGGPTAPPPDEREVTAPPVAFLSPDPDKIVYVRVSSILTDQGVTRERAVVEEWHRGSESRKLDRWTDEDGQDWAVESVIDADGVMRRIDETGWYRVFRKTEDTKTTIEQQQAGYLADFQRRAEQGTLDPAAHVFNGRPAFRYHIPSEPPARRDQVPSEPPIPPGPLGGPDQSYYVDRETGAPLGFTSEMQMGPDRPPLTTQKTVEEIKLLDPTPENLAQLREFTLKRSGR